MYILFNVFSCIACSHNITIFCSHAWLFQAVIFHPYFFQDSDPISIMWFTKVCCTLCPYAFLSHLFVKYLKVYFLLATVKKNSYEKFQYLVAYKNKHLLISKTVSWLEVSWSNMSSAWGTCSLCVSHSLTGIRKLIQIHSSHFVDQRWKQASKKRKVSWVLDLQFTCHHPFLLPFCHPNERTWPFPKSRAKDIFSIHNGGILQHFQWMW